MMRLVLSVALVFVLSIGGGAATVRYALDHLAALEGLTIGPWIAFPDRGSPDADPYSKARFSRKAELPLGPSEGLAFVAGVDSAGAALRRDCSYRIEGKAPAARFWTLHPSAESGTPPEPQAMRWPGLHSMQILRREDDSFEVTASPRPHPGNWLVTGGEGPLSLVFTLYDAPTIRNLDAARVDLPLIYRAGCE
ncbi:DUF1214 domain-containing protein [Aquibium carbonis]|uniref:DUF1214 domain-containing protein n=1 Tax=Aquibium carbonis TaxID=2495581 RepID=A0A3R9XYJ1_9HYPH|nr:DUF1214 domain-containing protein [Aquibium carbonis]RST78961.1 DUF1214 domain-containing protein [Aquibium carbonis]